jgi:hypothetical protein
VVAGTPASRVVRVTPTGDTVDRWDGPRLIIERVVGPDRAAGRGRQGAAIRLSPARTSDAGTPSDRDIVRLTSYDWRGVGAAAGGPCDVRGVCTWCGLAPWRPSLPGWPTRGGHRGTSADIGGRPGPRCRMKRGQAGMGRYDALPRDTGPPSDR